MAQQSRYSHLAEMGSEIKEAYHKSLSIQEQRRLLTFLSLSEVQCTVPEASAYHIEVVSQCFGCHWNAPNKSIPSLCMTVTQKMSWDAHYKCHHGHRDVIMVYISCNVS